MYMNKENFKCCHKIYKNNFNPVEINGFSLENSYAEIDELIYPLIVLLNMKGYKTEFCCSGHFNGDVYEYYQDTKEEIDKIKNIVSSLSEEDSIHIEESKNHSTLFYLVESSYDRNPYIAFDKIYEFNNLPEGWYHETNNDCSILRFHMDKNDTSYHSFFGFYGSMLKHLEDLYQYIINDLDGECMII